MANLTPTPLTDQHFIRDQILCFACKLSDKSAKEYPQIIHYQTLTPDSEVSLFAFDGRIWCMYQEDYIPSINHVKNKIRDWVGKDHNFKLLLAAKPYETLRDAPPVRNARVYKLPDNAQDDFRPYTDTNGYYFVFLARMASKNYFDFVG